MFNLNLNMIDPTRTSNDRKYNVRWVRMAKMRNTQFAVDVAARKVLGVVSEDRAVRDALSTLRQAKATIKCYGASESIMAIFNAGGQLGDCIGMAIPEITSVNARSVGIACCENIDEAIEDAYEQVRKFFDSFIDSVAKFFDKLDAQLECQKATIDDVIENIIGDVEMIDAEAFSTEETFGYTQPVFMQRVQALTHIAQGIGNCECTTEAMRAFEEDLKVLGYKVVEKSQEELDVESEVEAPAANEPELVIVPETPAEQEADAPAPEEVMNPEPDAPKEVQPVQPDTMNPQPLPAVSTENDEIPAEAPADAPQEQTLAVFRWTPETIRTAACAVKGMLEASSNMRSLNRTIGEVKGTVDAAIDCVVEAEGEDKTECENKIEMGRRFAAFVGDIINVYGEAVNELVDQVVCLAGILVAAQPSDADEEQTAVPVERVTEQDPLAEQTVGGATAVTAYYRNAGFWDEDAPVEPAEEPISPAAAPVAAPAAVTPVVQEPVVTAAPEEPTVASFYWYNNIEDPNEMPDGDEPETGRTDPNGDIGLVEPADADETYFTPPIEEVEVPNDGAAEIDDIFYNYWNSGKDDEDEEDEDEDKKSKSKKDDIVELDEVEDDDDDKKSKKGKSKKDDDEDEEDEDDDKKSKSKKKDDDDDEEESSSESFFDYWWNAKDSEDEDEEDDDSKSDEEEDDEPKGKKGKKSDDDEDEDDADDDDDDKDDKPKKGGKSKSDDEEEDDEDTKDRWWNYYDEDELVEPVVEEPVYQPIEPVVHEEPIVPAEPVHGVEPIVHEPVVNPDPTEEQPIVQPEPVVEDPVYQPVEEVEVTDSWWFDEGEPLGEEPVAQPVVTPIEEQEIVEQPVIDPAPVVEEPIIEPTPEQVEPIVHEPVVGPDGQPAQGIIVEEPTDAQLADWFMNGIEEPDGVFEEEDMDVDEPETGDIDPNGEAHPGIAEHVEPVETLEEDQQDMPAEKFLGDMFNW